MRISQIQNVAKESRQIAVDAIGRLPDQISVQRFISAATRIGTHDHYKVFPRESLAILDAVRERVGEAGVRAYLRAVLAQAVVDLTGSERLRTLPPTVLRNHLIHLSRIGSDIDFRQNWLDIAEDLFQKDFGLATLRLYGAAAQLVDYRCRVPRSIVFREGAVRAPVKIKAFFKMGGFQPYFQIHTHKSYLDEFNQDGWDECYRCCAELYTIHPKARGMFGSSWFYDPALDGISPRLKYLREIPLAGGAYLMFVQDGGNAIYDSTATSPTRRSLYEEGKYAPRIFMLIWGKAEQIQWAKAH